MDVGHVQLDDRASEDRQGIADAIAVVRPGARVDQDRVIPFLEAQVNTLDHQRFAVGLKGVDADAELRGQFGQACIDVLEGEGSVLRRVALAEHVVVDAM